MGVDQAQIWHAFYRELRQPPPTAETLTIPWTPIYWLLDPTPTTKLNRFLGRDGSRLLGLMTRQRLMTRERSREQILGPVQWGATASLQQVDSSLFQYARTHYCFDTLENQAYRFLLEQLSKFERAIPNFLRGGMCYPLETSAAALSVRDRIAWLQFQSKRLVTSPRMASLKPIKTITRAHFHALRENRLPEYHSLASLLRESAGLYSQPSSYLLLPGDLSDDSLLWLRGLALTFRKAPVFNVS